MRLWELIMQLAEPFAIDFNEKSVLAISCSSEDVSCTLVHNMLIQLYNNAATAPIEVYIFDDFQKDMKIFQNMLRQSIILLRLMEL